MEEVYENDYELLYLIRQKDEMAFAALMHKYEEIADKLIKKYIGACKSGLSEDDYLQLARLKLVQTIDDYREDQEASFYHYFCSVFHNLLIDCYRQSANDVCFPWIAVYARMREATVCLILWKSLMKALRFPMNFSIV